MNLLFGAFCWLIILAPLIVIILRTKITYKNKTYGPMWAWQITVEKLKKWGL
jgi:hypothetical protein